MSWFDFMKYRRRIAELERENKELRARAERAEQFWGERQKEVMCLAHDLQREKLKLAQIEAQAMKNLRPSFIIEAFCEILGITKEEFLANSNFQWEEKLKRALSENCVLKRDDDFSDIGGKLS